MAKKKGAASSSSRSRARPDARQRPVPRRATRRPPARSTPGSCTIYQVDAFTTRRFHGNPAAIVILERAWPADEMLQSIAAENNLAETAFVLPRAARGRAGVPRFGLRWFTPKIEVDLCGHATLAAAHALWNHEGVKGERVVFESKSGDLPVERMGNLIVLDFPRRVGLPCPVSDELCFALGKEPSEAYKAAGKIMAVYENRRDVYTLKPDFHKVAELGGLGVIATAPGSGHDFVSRFFAPRAGIDEDPVTGSAHCTLAPYWARRLGKESLKAHQVSPRGGELWCEDTGERVRIGGHAVTFLTGKIVVPRA